MNSRFKKVGICWKYLQKFLSNILTFGSQFSCLPRRPSHQRNVLEPAKHRLPLKPLSYRIEGIHGILKTNGHLTSSDKAMTLRNNSHTFADIVVLIGTRN